MGNIHLENRINNSISKLVNETNNYISLDIEQKYSPLNTNLFIVTDEWLVNNATSGVGFNKKQLAVFNLSYPLAKGWKKSLIGIGITQEQKSAFERFANKKAKRTVKKKAYCRITIINDNNSFNNKEKLKQIGFRWNLEEKIFTVVLKSLELCEYIEEKLDELHIRYDTDVFDD